MNQNQVPQPLFAPASQSAQQDADDFDLHEIFAEYFINEFDDPLNAYTGGMANYSGGATAVAASQEAAASTTDQSKASSSMIPGGNGMTSLPTGGIRTSFHTGSISPAPATKKFKVEDPLANTAPTPRSAMLNQQQPSTGIIGSIPSGAMVQPAAAPVTFAPTPIAPAQHPPQNAAPATTQAGVALPVGVGIRLGGVGGVQSLAQTTQSHTAPGVVGPGTQYSHTAAWAPTSQGDQDNGGVSEQAVAERRQRNREHAKRSRVRKKFMLESLQEQVRGLQKENTRLRMLVQEHIPEHAMQIISECCTKNPLFEENSGGAAGAGAQKGDKADQLVRADFSLMQSLASGQKCFVLSDPKLPDNPIVFATPDFYTLTGYTSKEVLGRNCRFLQGPGTDKKAVDVIRKAIATGSDATVCLMNYKADGTPFWNQFFIAALRDSDNNIVNFVGVQTEVEPETSGSSYLEDKVNAVLPLQNKEGE